MLKSAFHAGDRVVTNKPLSSIPVGSVGTVVKVYTVSYYDVLLDGSSMPYALFAADLDLVRAADADDVTAERQ